ncbi:MAG: YicC/YloC family endoribonuclease [Pseudomonadota bacterium]
MRSMTGFASISDERWRWDARSVNGRGLELRFRLPPGWEAQEQTFRALVGKRFQRGSLSVSLTRLETAATRGPSLNGEVLQTVVDAALTAQRKLRRAGSEGSIAVDGLLALRGVLDTEGSERQAAPDEAGAGAVASLLGQLCDRLEEARAAEGARLRSILAGQIAEIERLTRVAQERAAVRAGDAGQRLAEKVRALMAAGAEMDEARMVQELALLAVKQDVTEEIDRLLAHVAAARGHLEAAEPVGRKLDFLTQEFNREANTLCSKSQDVALTEAGMALKFVIDQMREQAANVE